MAGGRSSFKTTLCGLNTTYDCVQNNLALYDPEPQALLSP
jgi:hypothetical protein